MLSLERLPTEVLYRISQDVGLLGSCELVSLTRASRRFHAISNPVLYATDVQESGGARSMCFGLASGQHRVVSLCLAAGTKPDLRVESRHDLEAMFLPGRAQEEEGGALRFSSWSRDHLGMGRNGRRSPPGPARCPPGARYADPNRDMNKPFLSARAFFWTPLHVAALLNDVELLALLLDHGADPNSAGRGVCPCYYQGLRRTLDRSLPPEDQDPTVEMLERRVATRWSALHVAVCKGNLDSAEHLLTRSGLPHATGSDDAAAMAQARRFFQEEPILSDLARSDPDAINHVTPRFDPLPPLHAAVDRRGSPGDLERLHAMLQRAGCLGPDVDVPDAFGDTPLAVAAFAGRSETVGTWLRDRGADVNFALLGPDDVRYSILNALCKSGQHRDATSLMDLGGVDINTDAELRRGLRYESPLHLCCGWRYSTGEWPAEERPRRQREAATLLGRLVRGGADLEARDEDGMTPLMSAAAAHFSAAVRVLLEGRAEVGAEDDDGDSALHHAVAQGADCLPGEHLSSALATIQLLLDHGADPNQQRADVNETPLFSGSYSVTLGTPGDNPRRYTSSRSGGGNTSAMASIATLLINRGADPNIYLDHPRAAANTLAEQVFDVQGHSLAVTAFYEGEFDTLDSLVACGTLITQQDYLLMMRSLLDPRIRSKGSKSGAVQALFRLLNGPAMQQQLEKPQDRRGIMDAWTELLILAVGERPGLVRVLAPHLSVTPRLAPGGRTALHVLAQWERRGGERAARFQHRVDRMMAALMRCGAARQVDQPDDGGRTPLHVAGGWRNLPVARALVRAGASLHVEPRRPDGTVVDSPLRTAIRGYSEASWFRMADGMLDAYHSKWGRKQGGHCGGAGLLKDLILHFRDHPFDDPARTASRTKTLLVKLLDLGVDANEPDEDGNTPLHLLVQLLYPPDKDAEGIIRTSDKSKRARDNSVDPPGPEGLDPASVFNMPSEAYMHMRGVNSGYPSDSDFEQASEEEDQQTTTDDDKGASDDDDDDEHAHGSPAAEDCSDDDDDQDGSDAEQQNNADDDSSLFGDFFKGNSLRVMARKDDGGERPQYKPSGLAKRGRRRKLDRADAWILAFYVLLCEAKGGDGLNTRNKAGRTPLDLIRGLRGVPVPRSSALRRVVKALGRFDAADPLGCAVLHRLNGASVLPKEKDRPFFFVYNCSGCYLVVPRQGGKRGAKRRGPAWDKWTWVPFW